MARKWVRALAVSCWAQSRTPLRSREPQAQTAPKTQVNASEAGSIAEDTAEENQEKPSLDATFNRGLTPNACRFRDLKHPPCRSLVTRCG